MLESKIIKTLIKKCHVARERVPRAHPKECQNVTESGMFSDIYHKNSLEFQFRGKPSLKNNLLHPFGHNSKQVKYDMNCTGLEKQGKLIFRVFTALKLSTKFRFNFLEHMVYYGIFFEKHFKVEEFQMLSA